jgi:hypothetical protein
MLQGTANIQSWLKVKKRKIAVRSVNDIVTVRSVDDTVMVLTVSGT